MKRNAQCKPTASKSRKVCLTIAPQILMVNQPFLHLNCHKLRYPHLLNRSISRICWFNMPKQQFLLVKFRIFLSFLRSPLPRNPHIPDILEIVSLWLAARAPILFTASHNISRQCQVRRRIVLYGRIQPKRKDKRT